MDTVKKGKVTAEQTTLVTVKTDGKEWIAVATKIPQNAPRAITVKVFVTTMENANAIRTRL